MLRIRAVINGEVLAFNKALSPHCFEERNDYIAKIFSSEIGNPSLIFARPSSSILMIEGRESWRIFATDRGKHTVGTGVYSRK
jgi:hypothetical protein